MKEQILMWWTIITGILSLISLGIWIKTGCIEYKTHDTCILEGNRFKFKRSKQKIFMRCFKCNYWMEQRNEENILICSNCAKEFQCDIKGLLGKMENLWNKSVIDKILILSWK